MFSGFARENKGNRIFSIERCAFGMTLELREALKGLIEERTYRRKAA